MPKFKQIMEIGFSTMIQDWKEAAEIQAQFPHPICQRLKVPTELRHNNPCRTVFRMSFRMQRRKIRGALTHELQSPSQRSIFIWSFYYSTSVFMSSFRTPCHSCFQLKSWFLYYSSISTQLNKALLAFRFLTSLGGSNTVQRLVKVKRGKKKSVKSFCNENFN